jgi:long-chain acyl-CoA synthetase
MQAVEEFRGIAQVLEPALGEDPGRRAIVARSGELTYAELDLAANRWARALRDQGVSPGDRIGVTMPNDLDIVAAFHGAMRLGAVWVGINDALAAPEKAYMLSDSEASLFLCGSGVADGMAAVAGELPGDLRIVDALSTEEDGWLAALAAQSAEAIGLSVDPFAAAGIAYTSGTTGFPKGVVQSQYNMLAPGAHLNATRGYGIDLRKGDCFPLTILNLLILTTLLVSQAKGLQVVMEQVSADNVGKWVREEGVTVWNGPPPILYSMAHDDSITAADLHTLKEVWSGGADIPESIRDAFESKFGVEVRGTYGLTEAPTMVTIEAPGAEHVHGSSGRPLPHLELSIRDEDGVPVAPDEVGELCVGPAAPEAIAARLAEDWGVDDADAASLPTYRPMLGYWNKPEATADALKDGILHTGDAGSITERGELAISDRISLMLNRGGANVYPAEVERVVMAFAAVDSCGVFGVPDERLGERVAVLVQARPGAEVDPVGLVEYCRAQLAAYKAPEWVVAVDGLPRNAMGKVDRRRLAEIGLEAVTGRERIRPAAAGPA